MTPEEPRSGGLTPPGPTVGERTGHGAGSADEWRTAYPSPPVGSGSSYGGFPAGSGPPPSQKMAGWALGLSLAICVPFAFLAGAGLAIAVLVKSRDGRNHGKGKAVAALVIAGLLLVVNVAYVVVVFFFGIDETQRDDSGRVVDGGQVTLDRLRVGDCYNEPGLADLPTDGSEGEGSASVHVVPCSEPHLAELFHIVTVPGDDFPGDSAVQRQSAACLPAFADYVGTPYQESRLEVVFYYPTSLSWRFGDRSILCSMVGSDPGETLPRSMRGSGR